MSWKRERMCKEFVTNNQILVVKIIKIRPPHPPPPPLIRFYAFFRPPSLPRLLRPFVYSGPKSKCTSCQQFALWTRSRSPPRPERNFSSSYYSEKMLWGRFCFRSLEFVILQKSRDRQHQNSWCCSKNQPFQFSIKSPWSPRVAIELFINTRLIALAFRIFKIKG